MFSIFNSLYALYVSVKGKRRLRIYSPDRKKKQSEIFVKSINGFEFEIHCKEINYCYSFSNKLFSSRVYVLYALYGTSSKNAPEKLKNILNRKVYIPRLSPWFIPWNMSKFYIVEAYLDTIISVLKEDAPENLLDSVLFEKHNDFDNN